MQHQTHTTSTGNITYRGYCITGTRGAYALCGQTYKTLDEATAEVDKIVARNEEDLCDGCGYHVTRCRMLPACLGQQTVGDQVLKGDLPLHELDAPF